MGMLTRDTQSPISTRDFFDKFLRVPNGAGRLVPMALHPEQERILTKWDEIDPLTGLPKYLWVHADWMKKTGKSTTDGGIGLKELVIGSEPDREITIVGNDYQQSKDISFTSCVRFVRRHPWLEKNIRILSDTLVYKETVVDPVTGGRHVQEHIIRAVPARDVRSLHGANPTLLILDELHGFNNYDVIEALAASPTRRVSRQFSTSYKGLRSQMREGIPLFDLLQRWQAGTDPQLFVSTLAGPEAWKSIPWIAARFIESQRRQFAAVPSKFRRLWLNEWATGDEGSFLTGEEIHAAIDPALTEPERGEPNVLYTMGVDLGLTYDWTGIVVSHVGADHRLVVDAVRYWRGTRTTPASVMAVEDEIIALSKRFRLERCVLDQWQARLLSERLNQRGLINTFSVAVDPARLDHMAVQLKATFAARHIRIPQHPELVEQLETIVGVEQKRRDLVRFTSGSGQGAGRHDDLVVALCLSMESQAADIGRVQLPAALDQCYRAATVPMNILGCYLLGGSMPGVSGDPSCAACPGHRHVKQEHQRYLARGGQPVTLREYRRLHVLDNAWVAQVKADRFVSHGLGL